MNLADALPFILGGGLALSDMNTSSPSVHSSQVSTPGSWGGLGAGTTDSVWGDLMANLGAISGLQGEDYLHKMQSLEDRYQGLAGLGQDYKGDLSSAHGAYNTRMDELQRPAFNLSLGGQQFGVTPRRNAMLADMAENVLTNRVSRAGSELSLDSALLEEQFNKQQQTAPSSQYSDAAEKLWPYMSQMQDWRYSNPSVSATETGDYTPTPSEVAGNFASTYGVFDDLINGISGGSAAGGGGLASLLGGGGGLSSLFGGGGAGTAGVAGMTPAGAGLGGGAAAGAAPGLSGAAAAGVSPFLAAAPFAAMGAYILNKGMQQNSGPDQGINPVEYLNQAKAGAKNYTNPETGQVFTITPESIEKVKNSLFMTHGAGGVKNPYHNPNYMR